MRSRRLTLGFLILFLTAPLGFAPLRAEPHLALTVTPVLSRAPANVEIRATISTVPDDRTLTFVAESPTFYRSSEVPLGEQSPANWVIRYRDLPEGNYSITVTITSANGATRSVTKAARVI
jgi:hypothetical protein